MTAVVVVLHRAARSAGTVAGGLIGICHLAAFYITEHLIDRRKP